MVNRREKAVAEQYGADGWSPIRGGWPDWLMLRVEDAAIVGVECVEVKSPSGRLSHEQKLVRRALEDHLGATYRVEVVE